MEPDETGEGGTVVLPSEGINYMDLIEFREFGYLHELNRLFLHPLGLAVEVRSPWEKGAIQGWLEERGVQFGEDAIECIWTFIVASGLDKDHLGGVWDYRDDPEGMCFGDDMIDGDKVDRVYSEGIMRRPARESALGYWIQPSPPA